MALKIKKTILDSQGRIIEELEGTESEIESYMKKKSKREETVKNEQAKKKGILLGKGVREEIQAMIDAAIAKHAVTNHLNLQPYRTIEHHWYHNNGWWWQPRYDGPTITYCATNQDPKVYGTAGTITCNTVGELSIKTGINANDISTAPAITSTGGELTWATNNVGDSISGMKYGTMDASSMYLSDVTSGIINMNIKS